MTNCGFTYESWNRSGKVRTSADFNDNFVRIRGLVLLKYEKGEQQYLDLLKDVLDNGKLVEDRTNTGCIRVFSVA